MALHTNAARQPLSVPLLAAAVLYLQTKSKRDPCGSRFAVIAQNSDNVLPASVSLFCCRLRYFFGVKPTFLVKMLMKLLAEL